MKIVLTGLALLMGMTSVSRAQQVASFALIHHNIHSGGQARDAADHIADLLEMTPQKGLVLCNEANNARQYFTLPYTGWSHIWPSSPFEAKGNPTFVRNAVLTMLSSSRVEMQATWTWNDNNREPRVYTLVKCQMVSEPWVQFNCVNVHFPPSNSTNGPARQESVDRIIALSASLPDLPLIICGDFNFSESQVRTQIASKIGGTLYSNASVDHIIVRPGPGVDFGNVTVQRLGVFISDHQALRYNINFTQQTSTISDWTLY